MKKGDTSTTLNFKGEARTDNCISVLEEGMNNFFGREMELREDLLPEVKL